jgi:hypothetical protein
MDRARVARVVLAALLSLPAGALVACGEAREAANQVEKGVEKGAEEVKKGAEEVKKGVDKAADDKDKGGGSDY